MRRAYCATFFAIACLCFAQPSRAQIAFVPGPQRSVAQGPTYIAAADFNSDGIQDAAVSSAFVSSAVVSVLFGSQSGGFESVVNVPVGRRLRGITTGDFNGDAVSDIAVTDLSLRRVFVIPGNKVGGRGNGTFGPPASYSIGRRGGIDISTGNLDCPAGCSDPALAGLDLVTSNGNGNSMTLLFNLGGSAGFEAQPNVVTGKNAHAIAVKDFNGDGADDIALLVTGVRAADSVSVYLNNGTGAFSSAVPVNYTVGVAATSLTIRDFNDDGVPDIAVLNNGGGTMGFSVSVLLNQATKLPDGTFRGSGLFTVLPAQKVSCPAMLNGIPISCIPEDIVSADFDSDGFNDFAVSFDTRAVFSTAVVPGVVSAYAGRGRGLFDFATQIIVGPGPRGMAAGDFTGDGVPDIAVTEYSSSTVRILRGVAPPPRPSGWPCTEDGQCQTGFCVDGTCCNSRSCPSGEFCDISGSEGTCSPPGPNGIPCDSAAQCQSGFCVDEFCCSAASCPGGQYCNTGDCAGPAISGTPCSLDAQCVSGHCVDGVCCDSDVCPGSQACNIPGQEGQCVPTLPLGTPCTAPNQCDSGFCTDGVCCYTELCPEGQACNIAGILGQCAFLPTPTTTPSRTPTATLTPTATKTPTPAPLGAPCSVGVQCESTFCVDGVCCSAASCPAGQICNYSLFLGECHQKGHPPDPCNSNSDCDTNYCFAGHCAVPPTSTPTLTATPTLTPTPLSLGDPCSADSQCASHHCTDGVCCTTGPCAPGYSCAIPGSLGFCVLIPPTFTPTLTATPTVTPTPRRPLGSPCTDPLQCLSDNCVDNTCCDSATCQDPMRCDIYRYKGTCTQPLPVGDLCEKNTDCEQGLVCNPDTGLCDLPPPATPTLPPVTPTPQCGPNQVVINGACADVSTSRSGGCSIGDPSAEGTSAVAWLLALLPLAFGIRRLRRQGVRAPLHRRARGQ